jgi:hypothetical protein
MCFRIQQEMFYMCFRIQQEMFHMVSHLPAETTLLKPGALGGKSHLLFQVLTVLPCVSACLCCAAATCMVT